MSCLITLCHGITLNMLNNNCFHEFLCLGKIAQERDEISGKHSQACPKFRTKSADASQNSPHGWLVVSN